MNLRRRSARERLSDLTPREIEVARLIAQDLLNKEIAFSLQVRPKTLDRHVAAIKEKAEVRTRAGIGAVAALAGMLE